ncbi:hypothetical protein BCD49_28170 [Pseudofrankia sp. EUN1h]|nr:hypothetical protein BCD49_28170 [Pseudofrankia sp. EUN1h]
MRLTPLTASCPSGSCPQVYATDSGTIVVQGVLLDASALDVRTSTGEVLVEIPSELFRAAADAALDGVD